MQIAAFNTLVLVVENGDPYRTRTCNLLLRRQLLYPVELRSRWQAI
jgi:hypothetical protein